MILKKLVISGLPGFSHNNTQTVEFDGFGKITSFVGPNSSGKTTVLNAIANILKFFSQTSFDFKYINEEEWIKWSSADIIFDTSSLEDNEVPPLGDTIGGSSNTIRFVLKRNPADTKQCLISLIETERGTLTLADMKTLFLPNAKVETINEEIKKIQMTIGQKQTELNNYANQSRLQAQIQTVTKQIEEYNTQIAQKIAEKNIQSIELINFERTPLNTPVTIHRTHLATFLKKLKFKDVHYIAFGKNAIDSVQEMIDKAIESKADRRSHLHENIVKDLTHLLEIKVELFQDPETKKNMLLIGGKSYNKISHGAQVCLYYYSYIYSSNNNAIVIWDEPENGLHATRRYKLFELLKDDPRYFIIATHSPELSPVLDTQCEVYRSYSEYNDNDDEVELNLIRATTRRDAFRIIEDLGIAASRVLFTSNLVIWVEGPSDLYFFRHWLNLLAKDENLVEGFDYAFMFFGGTLLSHFEIDEIAISNFTKDILSINKNFAFIVDSDLEASPELEDPLSWLKPAPKKIYLSVNELNSQKNNKTAFFQYTQGREVENYLPDRAIQYAVKNLITYTPEELALLNIEDFRLEQFTKYYKSLEEYVKNKKILANTKHAPPKGISKWGEVNKAEFMKKALECPDLKISELNWKGEQRVLELFNWIKSRKNQR